MRQLTFKNDTAPVDVFSKLPMRQLTLKLLSFLLDLISKLPMRQLSDFSQNDSVAFFSKLPMRQLTMLERKKKPTVRALIHLFPTLTQIYSCLEIY